MGLIDEMLLKVLCHNLCVLVQSIYELDIAPVFWPTKAVAAAGARQDPSQGLSVISVFLSAGVTCTARRHANVAVLLRSG